MADIWIPATRASLLPGEIGAFEAVLENIPPLPVSVKRIVEMAGDSDTDPRELAEVASTDPALASRILRMVNSSWYGMSRKIDNLRLAIVLLGPDEVKKIAVQCGFLHVIGGTNGDSRRAVREIWRHSYIVSVLAETFVSEDDPQRAGVLATFGILHDIGKAALEGMNDMLRQQNRETPDDPKRTRGMYALQKEEWRYSINHAVAGALLAGKWGLSDRIVAVLEHHHHPSFFGVNEMPADYAEDIITVNLADLMAEHLGNAENPPPEPHQVFFDMLGIEGPLERLLTPALRETYGKTREFVETMF